MSGQPTASELGRGRSGIVQRNQTPSGRTVARKTFRSTGVARAVQLTLLGYPNPYEWNHDAIRCAQLRRSIVAELIDWWFAGRKLRVARAFATGWSRSQRAFFIDTELVEGRHAALVHPVRGDRRDEVDDLVGDVLPRLHRRLRESGLEGLLWQAGYGNPVALGNFMVEEARGERRWVWVDLESGVPAVAPASVRALVRHYLPAVWRLRRAPFDDVDVVRLSEYVEQNADKLESDLGTARYHAMQSDIAALALHQTAWKQVKRVEGNVTRAFRRRTIGVAAAMTYLRSPWRWYLHAVRVAANETLKRSARMVRHGWHRIRSLSLQSASDFARALLSADGRAAVARRQITGRLERWASRQQLNHADFERLRRELSRDTASGYIADFGVHLAIKPAVKLVEYWFLPLLAVFGVIDPLVVGIAIAGLGSVGRTVYTLSRFALRGSRTQQPWVALGVGALPVLGNLAFPLQLVRSGRSASGGVARFVVVETFASCGRRLPIWGGVDTRAEHVAAALGSRLLGWFGGAPCASPVPSKWSAKSLGAVR